MHLTPSRPWYISVLKKRGSRHSMINPLSKQCPPGEKNNNPLYFFSRPSFWQCRCLSGVLLCDVILEVPEFGLGSLPPAATTLWPSPTPGPAPGPVVDPTPSRLADCSTASECSLAFIRRAATLAVRLLWHPYGGRKERLIGSGTQQEHRGLPNEVHRTSLGESCPSQGLFYVNLILHRQSSFV